MTAQRLRRGSPGRPRTRQRTPADHGYTFPAEWTRHAGTWISWPRPEGISFPGRYQECIDNVVEVIRAISRFEPVHLNVPNIDYELIVRARLAVRKVPTRRIRFHHIPTNECWTRDHGPAFVVRSQRGRSEAAVVDWGYNAWGGKYPPFDSDDLVPTRVGEALSLPVFSPGIVMEGGAIDVNGAGTLMTTRSCLLNRNRNPGRPKAELERYLKAYYGQRHVIWLGDGIAGDDTDGHIDDLARFVDTRTIVIGMEHDVRDPNFKVLEENRRRLERMRDQDGRPFEVVELPMPRPLVYANQRLPATYVNFYFVNGAVLVPTFGQASRDDRALAILRRLMPSREVVGVNCRALAWGLGAIHCLTQQQPRFDAPAGRSYEP
ncbi:MAG: agmatine deiminase family protein [Acidobacteriota bacterium]